jgi:hypothetical protein
MSRIVKNCIYCKSIFTPHKFNPRQIYCSEECKQKDRWPGNHKKVIRRICIGCNKEFLCGKYQYKRQLYCNIKCQEKHYRSIPKIIKRRSNRHKQRIKTDINYRLKYYLRIRLNKALGGNYKTGSAVKDLGCSVNELKIYLESLFKSGMTWDNHGEWHIDHKKPLAAFDLTNRLQILEACNYKNLQPLWKKDNLSKSDKYVLTSNRN